MPTLDSHPHIAFFFAIWAAVGPLAGIVIGHLLTRSWQRKQWLLDCRKEEFKELASVLSAEVLAHINWRAARRLRSSDAVPRANEARRAQLATLQVISDRVYIARDIAELKIHDRFNAIRTSLAKDDQQGDVETLRSLLNDIIERALQT